MTSPVNKVYGNIISPYARKVYLTLEHKGVAFEAIDVLPHAELEAFVAASPLGKVPGFEDEALRLSDSSVICDYLEHKYPEPPLYPSAPAERARALWIEEYADTRLQDLLLRGIVVERMVKPLVKGLPTDEARLARVLDEQLPPELDYVEDLCAEAAPFLVGNALSIADLALATAFINAGYAAFEIDRARWPRLSAYLGAICELPLFVNRLAAEAEYLAAARDGEDAS